MSDKPTTAAGYSAEYVDLVRATCLYIATKLGDLSDEVVVRPMLADASATEAVRIIERDFTAHDGLGARRVAEFLTGGPDDDIQASVVGFVRRFLSSL